MAKQETANNALQQLKASLKQKQADRLYIFHGEESFLLHHYLGLLKKMLVDELTESFNYNKLTRENFDMQGLANAVESLPMMAEHTFVWVDDIDIFKFTEEDRNHLTDLFMDIPDYCTLVFTFETVPWKPDKRYKKLWESISDNATIVEFGRQDQRDLIAWVSRHFGANGKKIDPQLCNYLIDITGGAMTTLAGEISKICAYSGAEQITKSDIDAVTEPVLDAVVFQMTDLLGEGRYGPALVKLHQLLKMQQEPIAILGAIGSHFRRLSSARTLLDNGKNSSALQKMYNLKEYPANKTMGAARNFSATFCAKAAEYILEADRQMKTSFDEPQRILEILILQLAREARDG